MKNLFTTLAFIILIASVSFAQCITVEHERYTICLDTIIKQPVYTYYELCKDDYDDNNCGRTLWQYDAKVDRKYQCRLQDYANSGYDRGHLAPAGDFNYSVQAVAETMIATNINPQNSHFNQGIWLKLENHVRALQKSYDVEVWTGVYFPTSKKQYAKSLLIPTHYWKMIKYADKYFAWVIPNVEPDETKSYGDYAIDPEIIKQFINKW